MKRFYRVSFADRRKKDVLIEGKSLEDAIRTGTLLYRCGFVVTIEKK